MAKGKKTPRDLPHPSKGRTANRLLQVAWWGSGYPADVALKGVLDYIAEQQRWSIHYRWELLDADWPAWEGAGVLVFGDPTPHARIIKQMQIPLVAILPPRNTPALSLPWVTEDNTAVGVLAAEHLLERGLKTFGFCGSHVPDEWVFACQRRDAFVHRLRQAGFPCAVMSLPSGDTSSFQSITQWLQVLPKPVGVLGVTSFLGQEILAACHRLKLAVPEDVAIITVKMDHEDELSEHPRLSYVKLNSHRIGYEAAALLDRLMSGAHAAAGTVHRIAPLGVEARQSSDILAISDPQVAAVLRYIWLHACDGIQVKDVFAMAHLSRRLFDQRFRSLIGRSPHAEIERVRMTRAKELLAGTNLSLEKIANCSGFAHAAHLVTTFRRVLGMTPGKYRDAQAMK